MLSTAETYRIAALEHLARAQDQFDCGSYYLTHYLSGLAVECHLRAHLRLKTKAFDSRHDLNRLASESGFYDAVSSVQVEDFSPIFEKINLRWRSNHRYFSERQLLDYLTSIKAEFNIRGTRWKNLARALLDSAHKIINEGESQWNRK